MNIYATTHTFNQKLLSLSPEQLSSLNLILKNIKKNYNNLNILEKRKNFSFIIYVTTDLTIKELSYLKIKDLNFILDNNKYLKENLYIFFEDFISNQNQDQYVLRQILKNKKISSNNLKKDIQSTLIKYSSYYKFTLHKKKLINIL